MKQHLLLLSFSIFTLLLNAQTSTEEALATIETQEQAKQFIKDKYSFNSKIFVFNEEKHKTQLAKALFKLEKGQVKQENSEYDKTLYKILDKTISSYYRVSYIFLDGNTHSLESINALRKTLILKYNNGISFNDLANRYSMDTNAKKGGDTGWFTLGNMHPDFENAISTNAHNLNDVYTVDIPSKNWYYLVLQTYKPKDITEIEVLKIIEPID
jgi:parvulin-like peptidyl-prolyl isomerase